MDLQSPSFSTASKDRADENDSFQLAPPLLSMPLGTGEETGRSIETGRRALDDQPPGRRCQCDLGTVRGRDRLEEPSALDLNDVSLPSFGDSVLQIAPDADEEDPGFREKVLNLESVVVTRGWVKAMLTQYSGETEDLCQTMHKDYDSRHGCLSGMQQAQELEGGVYSSFILNTPDFQSRHSSAKATYPGEQHLGGPNEESKHSSAISNNTNATAKPVRKAPKQMKRLYHEFLCSSFPVGITKRLASTFARSMGSKSSRIDKEALEAISEATDQYFRQLSNDLGVFANHAGRKVINESDVIAVMKR